MRRIIYYYKTFVGLDDLLKLEKCPVTHIHLSSIHFGFNNGEYYIHLNDYPPDDNRFINVWKQTRELQQRGVQIRLMIGGAGRAFNELFADFDNFYPLLVKCIDDYPWINGVDLDIEEDVDIYDVVKLVNLLRRDFGDDFKITMAPLSSALEMDIVGMGGFVYKDLEKLIGDKIEYYNGQFYGNFEVGSYECAILNHYDPSRVVMGMVSGQFTSKNFNKCLDVVIELCNKYENFGGVFIWEYNNAPPSNNHADWALLLNAVMNK